jgi:hypothetical protein
MDTSVLGAHHVQDSGRRNFCGGPHFAHRGGPAAASITRSSMVPSAVAAGGGGGGGGAPVPQVIAFPSRDFVSVAEPGGTTPTTAWSHPVGLACWSSSLTAPTSNMTPGDTITVDVPGGPASQQLAMTVSNVQTVQAKLAAGSTTTVVVTGSASDSAGNPITTPGLLEVRLVAKKSQFTFNGRRDLRAAIGGGKDGVLSYTSGTTNFTATFPLLGGRNTTTPLAEADARQAVASETRGLVQNDPVSPTWITIYETHVPGDGLVHGNAPGCPAQ